MKVNFISDTGNGFMVLYYTTIRYTVHGTRYTVLAKLCHLPYTTVEFNAMQTALFRPL